MKAGRAFSIILCGTIGCQIINSTWLLAEPRVETCQKEPGPAFTAPQVISDSLVKNLDCSTLTLESVLLKVQPDAFSWTRHLPVVNGKDTETQLWPFGSCWAQSVAQRRFFYFTRFGVSGSQSFEDLSFMDWSTILDGSSTDWSVREVRETRAPSDSLRKRRRGWATFDQETRDILAVTQIENFFSLKNLKYVFTSNEIKQENEAKFQKIRRDLSQGRVPMVIRRVGPGDLHVMLVTQIIPVVGTADEYIFETYDPNSPQAAEGGIETLTYKNGKFIAKKFTRVASEKVRDVDVFLTGEDEMDQIQKALYQYYRNLCDKKGVSGFK